MDLRIICSEATADAGAPKRAKAGSRGYSADERTSKEESYTKRHRGEAGIWDPAFENGEWVAAEFFCNPQERSESQGKVYSNLSTPGTVSNACSSQCPEVAITALYSGWNVPKKMLSLPKRSGNSRHLRLPADVAVTEGKRRHLPQSLENSACDAKIRPVGKDSPPQEMETDGPAGTQMRESSQPGLSRWSTERQIGNRYFPY